MEWFETPDAQVNITNITLEDGSVGLIVSVSRKTPT
jgi:hypothetical protein